MNLTKKNQTQEVDQLLARGRVSGPDRDRILQQVLQKTAPAKRREWGWRAWALAAGAAALGLVVILFRWNMGGGKSDESEFHARGLHPAEGPIIDVACRHGKEIKEGTCHLGDLLLFSVDGIKQKVWVVAYAESAQGDRIWYFPAEDGLMPSVTPGNPRLIDNAIVIGSEHSPGRYRVMVRVVDREMKREEVNSIPALGQRQIEIEVVP